MRAFQPSATRSISVAPRRTRSCCSSARPRTPTRPGTIGTLEQTLLLARAIASQAEKALRPEAERIAAMCEQGIDNARRRVWDDLAPAGQAPAGDGPPVWWDE